VNLRIRTLIAVALAAAMAVCGLLGLAIVFTVGGVRLPSLETDITRQQPYSSFIDREYRVTEVSAYAWNDFPDKARILSITLMPPPGAKNRFVSYVTRLQPGQRVRIVSARRRFGLVGFARHYVVSVPGADLPDDVPITMAVGADGIPDPRVYEPVGR
jgi:hypothetical protein